MSTHRVRLVAGQHEFSASSKQSLLKAGLEAGLNLKYGCETGSCGECLSRLVEGRIDPFRHSDFRLTDEQKQQGLFLSCCHSALSNCLLDMPEFGGVEDIPHQQISARVYKLQPLSSQVLSIVLKTPRTQSLEFLAGQHVTLDLGNELQRNKSIASCPCDGLRPEIHVQKRPGDPFSDYVFNRLQKNDRVEIQGPAGQFVMDDESTRPIIFLAFDTGFASIKSLLEHSVALEKPQPIRLYWIVTPNREPYLENYCRSIEDALDNVTYLPLAIKNESSYCVEQALRKILHQEQSLGIADWFVTLPPQFHATVQKEFSRGGIAPGEWKLDSHVHY
jgi:CDP-4-dehydro-6-deoxyglucose reductase